MKEQGLPSGEIARILKCNPKTIYNHLKEVDLTHQFIKHRSIILSYLQRRIIQSITDAKLQKSSAYQLAGMFALLYDKERLEMGLSTQNIAYADLVKAKQLANKELENLDKMYNKGAK